MTTGNSSADVQAGAGWYARIAAKYPPIPCATCGTPSLTVKEAGGSCLRCTIAAKVDGPELPGPF